MVVTDCPQTEPAADLLRQALDEAGLSEVMFIVTVITSDRQARECGFLGSPAFLVDGRDLFAVRGAAPALSCRLYPTIDGPVGTPPLNQLRDALHAAAQL